MLVTKLKAILPAMGGWHQHKCLPWCAIRTAFRPLSLLFQMWTIEGSWHSDFLFCWSKTAKTDITYPRLCIKKPHSSIFPETDLFVDWINMITLHNVSKLRTNRSIRSPLNMQFVNIQHIKMRRYLCQFFGSPQHSIK